MRIRKRVNRTDNAAASKEGAKNAEQEGAEDQPDVPDLHHAALFLHHHAVQKSRAGKPGEQRSVFDRIPTPVAAPAENGVCPVRAKQNADRLEAPVDHRPFTGEVNPLFAGVAGKQGGESKRKRNGEARVAGIKIWRMDDHFRVLQKRVEAVAVQAGKWLEHAACANRGEGLEGTLDEVIQYEKESLDAGEDHAHVWHEFPVFIAIGDENILKAERGDENQYAGGHSGLARALYQQRVASDDRGDSAD